MLSMLKDLSVKRFVQEVASESPAPGGGSVAALAGALAGGLISMYCQLSLNREKYGEAVTLMEKVGDEARAIAVRLVEAVDKDTAAFNEIMKAFRLPKATEEEKTMRKEAIQSATLEAARVPLQTAQSSLRLLELVSFAAGRGNPSAVTDLGVGNLQAAAGLRGAAYNVKINLSGIKDEQVKQELGEQTENILSQGEQLFEKNRKSIEGAI